MNPARSPEKTITLSTGETVSLPLVTRATAAIAGFTASADIVRDLLPANCSPIRLRPGRAIVLFVGVDYSHVSVQSIDPYNEFGVIIPTVHNPSNRPLASIRQSSLGGYVTDLPVTTESARALGVEIWGYPKTLAEITHTSTGNQWTTSVVADGDDIVTMIVNCPRTVACSLSARSFTETDGTLLATPVDLSGDIGAWALTDRASVTLGGHSRAEQFAALELADRSIFVGYIEDTECIVHPGEPASQI